MLKLFLPRCCLPRCLMMPPLLIFTRAPRHAMPPPYCATPCCRCDVAAVSLQRRHFFGRLLSPASRCRRQTPIFFFRRGGYHAAMFRFLRRSRFPDFFDIFISSSFTASQPSLLLHFIDIFTFSFRHASIRFHADTFRRCAGIDSSNTADERLIIFFDFLSPFRWPPMAPRRRRGFAFLRHFLLSRHFHFLRQILIHRHCAD